MMQTPRDLAVRVNMQGFGQDGFLPDMFWRDCGPSIRFPQVWGIRTALLLHLTTTEALVTDNNMKGYYLQWIPSRAFTAPIGRITLFCCLIVAVKWNRSKGQIGYTSMLGGIGLLPLLARSA
jgi:hypothetical protein